jgi:hypothetical protein
VNLYHDAFYICACGRESLFPVCSRCEAAPKPRKKSAPVLTNAGSDPTSFDFNEFGRRCVSYGGGVSVWETKADGPGGGGGGGYYEVWDSDADHRLGSFPLRCQAEDHADRCRAEKRHPSPPSLSPLLEDAAKATPAAASVSPALPVTDAMRAGIEEGKKTFAADGVFDLWGHALADGTMVYIPVSVGGKPTTPGCIPALRVRRIPESIRERWREVPLLPLVTKTNGGQG